MRLSVAALAVCLLVASFSLALAAPYGLDTSPCCSRHTQANITRHHVKSHFYTSSKCPLASVVFIFKKGRQACADPKAEWVQTLVKSLSTE
ncbi:C-C motif chemokine 5-like [Pogona vitticeps]